MKTRILVNSIVFLLLLSVKQSSAQNLVPLDWKISFSDPSSLATRDKTTSEQMGNVLFPLNLMLISQICNTRLLQKYNVTSFQ